MTLWVLRDGEQVKVQCTYGPVAFSVAEDISHLRSFWSELGRVLEEAEKPAEPAKA